MKDEYIDEDHLENYGEFSQGSRKLFNYFKAIIKLDTTQNWIKSIRTKYKISTDGYNSEDPGFIHESWKKAHPNDIESLLTNVHSFLNEFELNNDDWEELLLIYIFDDVLFAPFHQLFHGTCRLIDFEREEKAGQTKYYLESDRKTYPLAIKISPYASIRDILDFIRKNSSEILERQKPYQNPHSKIGKQRTRSLRKEVRNDFIYKHRHLALKDIAIKLSNEFGIDLDEGNIGKIISIENERRKDL